MSLQTGRYAAARLPNVAEGWTLERLTPPSHLFGANGLRTGPDGRLYVAQVSGSQISAIDIATGEVATISPHGGDIIAPDDVAFDPRGNLYATEFYDGRVSIVGADGSTRVLNGDLPAANGITFHQGRLFIDECRIGGRLMELDLNSGAAKVLLEDLPMPNAPEVGPDGMLYFPVLAANEIWRVNPEGGKSERVVGDLGAPDAVKFDSQGFIVSTQVGSGQVLRIDPRNGDKTVLATLEPGLDNLAFYNDRLFVSNFTGLISEILAGGETKTLLPGGFNWPLDLAIGDDGQLYIADGVRFYALRPGGEVKTLGMMLGSPGYPGYLRGVASLPDAAFIVTTANGEVALYRPNKGESEVLAAGFDQLYGVAAASGGASIVAEFGAGRVLSIEPGKVEVLASGLKQPMGVAVSADGSCLVSESGGGRVVKLTGKGVETVLDGLQRPQGILIRGPLLFVVDAGAKTVTEYDLDTKASRIIAADLPVGPPAGVTAKPLRGLLPLSGPQGPFAGITSGPDGTLYLSADGDGSVLALRRDEARRQA